MTTKPLKDWEIEFDKFRNFDGCEYGSDFHNRVKEFIQELLSQSKSQIVEQIEEKIEKAKYPKFKAKEGTFSPMWIRGFNDGVEECNRNLDRVRLQIKEEINKL